MFAKQLRKTIISENNISLILQKNIIPIPKINNNGGDIGCNNPNNCIYYLENLKNNKYNKKDTK